MASVFNIVEHTIGASHVREQYIPKDNPSPLKGDLTVIGAHANGFPKELYEPLWEDFYHEALKLGVRIRAIWVSDAAWQGRSGVLNQGKLGNDPSWNDYARDISLVINTFRMPRPLFAIGHSFGAVTLVQVALQNPRLFNGIALLEPSLGSWIISPGVFDFGPATLSFRRRDIWPSRKAAADFFRRSKFYQKWDSRVLDRWIEHGIRSVLGEADGPVTLTTSKHQELVTYSRPSWPAYDPEGKTRIHPEQAPDLDDTPYDGLTTFPLYRPEMNNTISRLPHLRPGALFVFGGESETKMPEQEGIGMAFVGRGIGGSGGVIAGRVKEVTLPDHGHLIPLEAPQFCAKEAAEWAKLELDRWWVEEREFEDWAKQQPLPDQISEEFARRLGFPGQHRGKEKAKL